MANKPVPEDPKITQVKRLIREDMLPYFEDEDFAFYLDRNDGVVEDAAYEMLIVKSEQSNLALVGLTTQDTSDYFKRLASRFKTYNTQTLEG